MSRDENGRVVISPTILVTIITACLGVGSSGALLAARGQTGSERQAVVVSDERIAKLEERISGNNARYAEIAAALQELSAQIARIDGKMERHIGYHSGQRGATPR